MKMATANKVKSRELMMGYGNDTKHERQWRSAESKCRSKAASIFQTAFRFGNGKNTRTERSLVQWEK